MRTSSSCDSRMARSSRVTDGRPRTPPPTLRCIDGSRRSGGVVHTHSVAAVGWAQARRPIPALGTTHADQFRGPVPVTRPLSAAEIAGAYEANTGAVIIETFECGGLSPVELSGVLVASHGPFTWGRDATEAATNAVGLEAIATMAFHTVLLRPDVQPVEDALLDRHFERKHGPGAYYGQPR